MWIHTSSALQLLMENFTNLMVGDQGQFHTVHPLQPPYCRMQPK
nr:hypothetical protein Iba_chr13eCG10570 [Ipomoea batatas]GME07443.1 hypothetical protein Iba_scaffold5973CG0100 [Ipomoea batatas]